MKVHGFDAKWNAADMNTNKLFSRKTRFGLKNKTFIKINALKIATFKSVNSVQSVGFLNHDIYIYLTKYRSACHEIQHIYRKKRNSDSEDPLNVLLTFFTDCMTERSNITFDWFSATDWAIEDSNWYYYSNTLDCAK